ncbi:urease accessory protein UreD [Dietzia aurantiaca]|uniref:Urease accessory protein UreD n=1 Tax=Dietzia aurantiaca TaxID=983873 RepID=A0ABV9PQ59_9ACTN
MNHRTGADTVTGSRLECTLVAGRGGRTRIASLLQEFPQRVTVPMYTDPGCASTAFVCVQNPTAGAFPGDDLTTRFTVGGDARLFLTQQAATQVFAGGAAATQTTVLDIAPGAVVEYVPKTVIPHADSEYRQRTEVSVSDSSVFLGWEAFAAGRIGHGERYAYQGISSRTDVLYSGRLRARESFRLAPGEADPDDPGLLGGHDYVASMLVVAPGRELTGLIAEFHAGIDATPGVTGAASTLPDGIGVSVRLLADRAPDLHRVHDLLWSTARRSVLDLGPLTSRM